MTSVKRFKTTSQKVFFNIPKRRKKQAQKRLPQEITKILSQPSKPYYYDSEEIFEQLQKLYLPRSGYDYDSYSTWERGVKRSGKLLKIISQLRQPGLNILEAGCGDGMTGYILEKYGHQATLTDFDDWRDERAKALPFVQSDLCTQLKLESDQYNLICSYNTFEHLEDPTTALAELIRVCKKGGYIYLNFGPLYASPWGLHANSTILMPYSQFLFSKTFIEKKLDQLGIQDLGQQRGSLQPLNRWRVKQFTHLWETSGCDIISCSTNSISSHLSLIKQYPMAFSGKALTFEDVTTYSIAVLLRKR